MSIGIYVPTYDSVCPETFKSIYLQQIPEGHDRILFDFVKGYACDAARTRCAIKALDSGVDYLMFVDSDIVLATRILHWEYIRVKTHQQGRLKFFQSLITILSMRTTLTYLIFPRNRLK